MKTSNIITIGDLHGRSHWKNFEDIDFLMPAEPHAAGFGAFVPEYDYYVFLADYVDSFTKTNMDIIDNLLELIRFKNLYPNNVILLWGNHDVEYWRNTPWTKGNIGISGFRPEIHYQLYEIFNRNVELFQLAFQYKNYLCTHAGVHFGWYHFVFKKAIKNDPYIEITDNMTIAEELNEAFLHRLPCLFDVDFYRGGSKRVGDPLWCDKQLTSKKPLKNMHQIVGHTPVDKIKTIVANGGSITYCDVLEDRRKYDKMFNTKEEKEEFYILTV